VGVDLGLDNPDRQLPRDIGSILYVACTRVRRLRDLFVSPIFPIIWDKIATSAGDVERRKVEEKLKKATREFASTKGMLREMDAELNWEPDYANCEAEWREIEDQIVQPVRKDPVEVSVANEDFRAQFDDGGTLRTFGMCLRPATTERHIGMDQGRHNFGIVAVDKKLGEPAVVVAAKNYDLALGPKFTAADVLIKLQDRTDLRCWMQQTDERRLPAVDRVVVHLEQMSSQNTHWKQFGPQLGKLLQQSVDDTATCIVKMSQPHLLRAGGVIHHLGQLIINELKLIPACYGVKRARSKPPRETVAAVQVMDTDDDTAGASVPSTSAVQTKSPRHSTPKKQTLVKLGRLQLDDVEPSDTSSSDDESQQVDDSEPEMMSSDMDYRYSV
jgi:hypothetical protein